MDLDRAGTGHQTLLQSLSVPSHSLQGKKEHPNKLTGVFRLATSAEGKRLTNKPAWLTGGFASVNSWSKGACGIWQRFHSKEPAPGWGEFCRASSQNPAQGLYSANDTKAKKQRGDTF